ncbi:MAG: hypothetical protein METHP_00598 [Methanoregula sp. SKADARSKE-2]|nr:MAG: hypothetical protein METHP_00598 [Methanoregula sp. SKADARSKE-2]
MKKKIVFVIIVTAATLAMGCTQTSPASAPPAPTPAITKPVVTKTIATAEPTLIAEPTLQQTVSVNDNTITLKRLAIDPEVLTIKAGASARWVNGDDSTHRIQFADGTTSQLMSHGQSWTTVFNNPGVYDYSDVIQPSMQGSVHVV